MKQPVYFYPEAMKSLQAVSKAIEGGIPQATLALVHDRVSQINGCATCLEATLRYGQKDSAERAITLAAWRDSPFFTDAERAALALAECVTRLADRPNPVPDDVWAEAARHYDEPALAALLISIAAINVWNRLNVATRQVAGANKW